MRHITRPAVPLRDRQRFHQMPAGKIGTADITNLAGGDQIVERAQGLFDRRGGVKTMQLKKIDIVGSQALQSAVYGANQVVSRGTDRIDIGSAAESRFGGDKNLIAAALDGRAENFFGSALGVNVGGIKHIQSGIKADINQAFGLGDIGIAPRLEQLAAPAKRARAQGQNRHFEAGSA